MSQEDADRAMSLLTAGRYQRIDASHVVHLDQPATFVRILEAFFLGKAAERATPDTTPECAAGIKPPCG